MKVAAIALNTCREAIRNRILYSILFFACLITGVAAAVGSVSIGDTIKFTKDFSLFSISLFGVMTTVVLGVNLLSKELNHRTIYNVLSKPMSRWEFLVGKFAGLSATLTIMVALLSGLLLGLLYVLEHHIDWQLLPVIATMLLELGILLAVALFFSSIVVTPMLAGLFTAAAFIAGRSVALLDYFFAADQRVSVRYPMEVLYIILPHLNRFYVADDVVSGHPLPLAYYCHVGVYAFSYIGVMLLLSVAIFRRREFV